MSGAQWDRTIPPNDEELIRAWIAHDRANLHTATVARVQSYDAATQTADLVPLVRNAVELPDGTTEHENLPVLPCVPVLFPRTAGHFIAFALAPGDMGLVVFCESAVGHWRAGDGDVTDPGDLTRHSLSHGVFLPGLFHRGGKLAHAPQASDPGAPRLVVGSDETDGARVTFGNDGTITITQGATVALRVDPDATVHVGGAAASQFVALASLVDARLSAIRTWLNTHTHPTPSGASSAPSTPLGAQDSVAATKAKAT